MAVIDLIRSIPSASKPPHTNPNRISPRLRVSAVKHRVVKP
jgi:hypothetical protein